MSNSSSARAVAEQLEIDYVGQRGDGVCRVSGEAVFVPFTLPGEVIETEPMPGHPDRRRLTRIIQPSADRIAPFCEYFGACGGCAIQHWQPSEYGKWKRQLVVDALDHAGIECRVDELIDAHGAGRRRITAHARRGSDGVLRVGFSAAGSHAVVAIEHCPILDPGLARAFEAARALADVLKPTEKPLDIQVTAASNGLDIDVRGSGPLATGIITRLSRVAEEHKLARLTRHGELVLMRTPPVIEINAARVALPPGSFLQATAAGEEALGQLVTAHCKRAKHVADLFCGIGPFALRLAAKSRVTAFDSDFGAVAALAKAVTTTSGLKPIKAEPRDLFRRPVVPQEMRDFDAVVFDPPRQGAEAQVRQLAMSKIPLVIAVSCNAATFARDARALIDGGYKLSSVTPVDQFRHSAHVELVAKFTK